MFIMICYYVYRDGITPFDTLSLKISYNGLQIDFPHILDMKMLMIACVMYLDLILELYQIYRYWRI